jgi:hypothetical protein
MIQGIGIKNVSTDSYRNNSNVQRKDGADSDVKKPAKEDEAVFSGVHEKETVDKQRADEIGKAVKDEYRKFQANLIGSMLKSIGITPNGLRINGENVKWEDVDFDSLLTAEQKNISPEQLVDMLPDEWKPDAVAERIVNFATGFYKASGLDAKEFYEKIKTAIDHGFGAADRQINGKLPGNIREVVEFTRKAVYDKLEKWAQGMGIQTPEAGEDKEAKLDVKA